jgi:hypothetical protein
MGGELREELEEVQSKIETLKMVEIYVYLGTQHGRLARFTPRVAEGQI